MDANYVHTLQKMLRKFPVCSYTFSAPSKEIKFLQVLPLQGRQDEGSDRPQIRSPPLLIYQGKRKPVQWSLIVDEPFIGSIRK